jgi:hypothetical protein
MKLNFKNVFPLKWVIKTALFLLVVEPQFKGHPELLSAPWRICFQNPETSVMESIISFHTKAASLATFIYSYLLAFKRLVKNLNRRVRSFSLLYSVKGLLPMILAQLAFLDTTSCAGEANPSGEGGVVYLVVVLIVGGIGSLLYYSWGGPTPPSNPLDAISASERYVYLGALRRTETRLLEELQSGRHPTDAAFLVDSAKFLSNQREIEEFLRHGVIPEPYNAAGGEGSWSFPDLGGILVNWLYQHNLLGDQNVCLYHTAVLRAGELFTSELFLQLVKGGGVVLGLGCLYYMIKRIYLAYFSSPLEKPLPPKKGQV